MNRTILHWKIVSVSWTRVQRGKGGGGGGTHCCIPSPIEDRAYKFLNTFKTANNRSLSSLLSTIIVLKHIFKLNLLALDNLSDMTQRVI